MAEMQSWRLRSPNLQSQIRIMVPVSFCSLNSLSLDDKTNLLALGNEISDIAFLGVFRFFVEAFDVFWC